MSDVEIVAALWNNELAITPIIDLKRQLSHSALDVRLGPDFVVKELSREKYMDPVELSHRWAYQLLYNPGSVRIWSERFRFLSEPIPLEACAGPFSPMFQAVWPPMPMPGSTLLFLPTDRTSKAWDAFDKARENGYLATALVERSPLNAVDFPTDGRTNVETVLTRRGAKPGDTIFTSRPIGLSQQRFRTLVAIANILI